ncbi:MAG: glycogen synthase GlgA [Rhodobacterales bacterium]|nr:glycogen synthase GlgA [Rhodobacterales bacterium]
MNLLFVSSEAYPLIKTGGLADVAGALPAALARTGVDARLLVPGYPAALDAAAKRRPAIDLGDPMGVGETRLIPAKMPDSGLPVWLIDCPALYDRPGGPYMDTNGRDWPDNHMRFAMLSRVATILAIGGALIGWRPDIVHANDWQAGLVPIYLNQWMGQRPSTVFTIHNLQFQGLFDASVVPAVGLGAENFAVDGVEYHGMVSYMKAGLQYADRLTTVSPTYAREIQTEAFGGGLHGVLRERATDLTGILNGADYDLWNPATDPILPGHFSARKLDGKAACKAALQKEMGLEEDPRAPLIGVVSRFSEQKGLDLVLDVIEAVQPEGAQLVVVGTGDPALEQAYAQATKVRPGRVAAYIGYDEELAHRVLAGCDILAVPSRFEPCGLTQIYALRYGTLPVVRRTGGLADTVVDISEEPKRGTGFLFEQPTAEMLLATLRRAMDLYLREKDWQAAIRRAMNQDFGWDRAAVRYLDLYDTLT